MNETQRLLSSLTEAAHMGADSVSMLMKKTEDPAMREELRRIAARYERTETRAKEHLTETGGKAKGANPMAKMGACMGVQMDTATDRSTSHLADMLIQGVTMGIIDIQKELAACGGADEESRRLAGEFLEDESREIEKLKGML